MIAKTFAPFPGVRPFAIMEERPNGPRSRHTSSICRDGNDGIKNRGLAVAGAGDRGPDAVDDLIRFGFGDLDELV
jgi:hypothetical protein